MKERITAWLVQLAAHKIPVICGFIGTAIVGTAVLAGPDLIEAFGTEAPWTTAPTEQVVQVETEPGQELPSSVDFVLNAPEKISNINMVHGIGAIDVAQIEQPEEVPEEVEYKKMDKDKIQVVEKAPEDDAADPNDGADDAGTGGEIDMGDIGDYEVAGMSFGIDVSHHQGKIDWNQVAQSGVKFAIIRVGYRSRDTGTIYEDREAANNLKGALAAGLKVGVYFFSQAINEFEAVEEASWVANYISKYQITYPVVYDLEYIGQYRTAAAGVTKSQRTDYAIAFMETIKSEGYTPMMYASKNGYAVNWETARLSNRYKIWVAQYPGNVNPSTDKSSYTGKHAMWQYTDKGKVPGIKTSVDMDVAYFDYAGTPSSSIQSVKILVKDKDGNPVPGVTVQLVGTEMSSAVTSGSGYAEFNYVAFGDYQLKIGGVPAGYKKPSKTVNLNFSKYAAEYVDNTSFVLEKGDDNSPEFIVGDEVFKRVNEDVIVTANSLNLRLEPRVAGDTQFTLVTKGTKLKRIGIGNGKWSAVEYKGRTLYCYTQYLKVAGEETCTEHKWGEVQVIADSTCLKEGKGTRTCTVCGAKEENYVIPKKEHVADTSKTGKIKQALVCGEKDEITLYPCKNEAKSDSPSMIEVVTKKASDYKHEYGKDGKCTHCGLIKETEPPTETETETETGIQPPTESQTPAESESSSESENGTEGLTEPVTEQSIENSTAAAS